MTSLRIIRRVGDLREAISSLRHAGDRIGLVPTMGALHEGHLELVRCASVECRHVIATIFVNPTQFSTGEDLSTYPKDEAGDVTLLEKERVDLLFVPTVEEIYPPGFATSVVVDGLTKHLCGPFRPGHFTGVATIVTKLLVLTLPDRAYFGEKDFQQLQVIRRCTLDLGLPVEIVGIPTVRDPDGLALSSRNRYLNPAERRIASLLPQVMRGAASELAGGKDAAPVLAAAQARLLSGGFDSLDYLDLCATGTLEPIANAGSSCRLFVAAWIGRTRLIDNWPVIA